MKNTGGGLPLTALCAVANEIRKLGLSVKESSFGKVRFRTDLEGAYRTLMALRTADRLLIEAAIFEADNFDALFEGARAVPWEDFIPPSAGLTVEKVRSNRSRIASETTTQGMVHKAVVGRLCEKRKIARLPEDGFNAELRVYIEKNVVSLLLDISGEPLFKRGYRTEGGAAPLRETTAAAIILLSMWKRRFPLFDPFCGSGTIVIEAALYAWDAAPCLGREFALAHLAIHNAKIEKQVREELLAKVDFNRVIRIFGSDSDPRSVSIAKSNVSRAYSLALGRKPKGGIQTETALPFLPAISITPFQKAVPPADESGFIITNPPYGKRLGSREEAQAGYADIAALCPDFAGWNLGVITDEPGFETFFGRKASSCREITNGASTSYFFHYNML